VDPFDDVNQRFHDAYDKARDAIVDDKPLVIVLADSLILRRGDERVELVVTPPLFQVVKAVAHGPLAIFGILHRHAPGPIADSTTHHALAKLQQSLTQAQVALSDDVVGDERDVAARLRAILARCQAFVHPLAAGGAHDPALLEPFARALGPALLAATHDATRVQLAAMTRAVSDLLARLDAHERRIFEVVVAGAHQARARSLAMQYFGKLLDEPPNVERRLVYAENVSDERQAVALMATRQLDRALAGAFFGHPERLQRDILGDAVKEQLTTAKLPSL
jgi:hypothetical protein